MNITPETTNQDVFNYVVNFLRAQGKKAMMVSRLRGRSGDISPPNTMTCAYRGNDGTKCAVGCLIPDHLYVRSMENITLPGLMKGFPTINDMFSRFEALLVALQTVHDMGTVKEWEGRFARVAKKFNLQMPERA